MISFRKDKDGNITGLSISPQNEREQDVARALDRIGILDTGVSFGDKRGKPLPEKKDIRDPAVQEYLKKVEKWYKAAE